MFNPINPVQTRDGREAKVYEVYPNKNILHGAIRTKDNWNVCIRRANGQMYELFQQPGDFINIPEKFEIRGWVNLYKKEYILSIIHNSRHDADNSASPERIACVEIVVKGNVGEGL